LTRAERARLATLSAPGRERVREVLTLFDGEITNVQASGAVSVDRIAARPGGARG
jgi:hypothetical protein